MLDEKQFFRGIAVSGNCTISAHFCTWISRQSAWLFDDHGQRRWLTTDRDIERDLRLRESNCVSQFPH
jgi:hypothetical protein